MLKIHLIGNAHLDAVWLWRWQEGYSEVLATFRSALDRIKEFDDFIFTCAGAIYYQWVEETDPDMFKEIQERVKEGKWIIVGGQMLQPDCNMPSGESFARHALYAQNYYKEKFGITATVGYNVDSFGHTAMLPQILKNSGLDYYVFMRPDKNEISLPFEDCCFIWTSPDGTAMPTFRIIESYLTRGFGEAERKAVEHKKLSEDLGDKPLMCFYGVGNHGGGPTIENILTLKKMQQGKNGEDFVFSSPNQFFEELDKSDLLKYKGDLFHHASGCYSAVMNVKSLNRISESHLMNAEKAGVMAVLTGVKENAENLKDAWIPTLFNHFHDIAGGCCIKSAIKDAEQFFGSSIYSADMAMNRALQAIAWNIDTSKGNPVVYDKQKFILWESENKGTPIVVFNMNSFSVKTPVKLGCLVESVEDNAGNKIASQSIRAEMTDGPKKYETEFIAEIPPMGWRLYWAFEEIEITESKETEFVNGVIENEFLAVTINNGYIESIYDKKAERTLCGVIKPIVIDETDADTWAHAKFKFDNICGEFGNARIIGFEKGDIRQELRLSYTYNNSELVLDINLYKDLPELYINSKVNWNEKHKMLKIVFPTDFGNYTEIGTVPFGFSERVSEEKEQPMQKWVALKDKDFGLGITTDTRSAYDVVDGAIRLTVLRSPAYADHFGQRDENMNYTDQGEQSFKIAIKPINNDFTELYQLSEKLLNNPSVVLGTYHKGKLGDTGSIINIDSDNINVTAFKTAESAKMKEKKYYIAFDDFERRVVVNCMNEMRNKLIADGKYTDALDEVLLKVIHSKQKNIKVIYKEV